MKNTLWQQTPQPIVAALCILLVAGPARAQSIPPGQSTNPPQRALPGQASDPQQVGEALRDVFKSSPIRVVLRNGEVVEGKFASVSPASLAIEVDGQPRSLATSDVSQVLRRVGTSRKKNALIAGLVGFAAGFGVGFAVGIPSNYVRTNPRRLEAGASLGILVGGISAGLGALLGGTRYEPLVEGSSDETR